MKIIDYNNAKETIGSRMLADGMDLIIDLDKSHGSWLVDARDGKEYLDVTRAEKMVYVFNMYYDGYGKGSILSIDYSTNFYNNVVPYYLSVGCYISI